MRPWLLAAAAALPLAAGFSTRVPMRMMSSNEAKPNFFQRAAERFGQAVAKERAASNFPTTPANLEDPGLKVAPMAWKWPPKWPYPLDSFEINNKAELEGDEAAVLVDQLMQGLPPLSETGAATLNRHYARSISGSAKVLVISDSVESAPAVEGANLDVTTHAVDLALLKGGELPFAADSFDHVVLPGGFLRYVTEPTDAFREVWRVVRPGGMAFAWFNNLRATNQIAEASRKESPETFEAVKDNTVKVWQSLNDAQRMWIVGSFFQFSAGTGLGGGDAGWEELKGYELTEEAFEVAASATALDGEEVDVPEVAAAEDDENAVYVVQARKQTPPTAEADPYKSMMYKLALQNTMNEPDRQLISLRLAAEMKRMPLPAGFDKDALVDRWVDAALETNAVLMQMSSVLGPDLRGLLGSLIAPHVASDRPGADLVLANLREGLGLETPGEAFWAPVGEATKSLSPEERVYLLGSFAPYFGEPAAAEALQELPMVLMRATEIVTSKLYPADADMYYEAENPDKPTKGECQTLAADLVLSDYLGSDGTGGSNAQPVTVHLLSAEERAGFLDWLESVDAAEMEQWAVTRRTFKEDALRVHEERLAAKRKAEGGEDAAAEESAAEAADEEPAVEAAAEEPAAEAAAEEPAAEAAAESA